MAVVYQISLHGHAYDARGKDWETVEAETGCNKNVEWRDPILGRPLLVTEFGCAVSHLRAWEAIASSGKNGIILEEDAVYHHFDAGQIDELLKVYDSVWLGYRFNTLGYWYNCHAYCITPATAEVLIKGFKGQVIPCDEWVPLKLKDMNNYFYPEEVVKQIPRNVRPSTIEEPDMNMHIITVGTDESRMWALNQSAAQYGITVHNLGKDLDWNDPMEGYAGMPKIDAVSEFVKDLPPLDVVLFMDAYDTVFADDAQTILERFKGFNVDILFGAEEHHWPNHNIKYQFPELPDTPYQYLNSGLYIGYAGPLFDFLSSKANIPDMGDDQLFCQIRFLHESRGLKVAMDTEAYIFQNHDEEVVIVNDQITNYRTNCCGCIYHGNGGNEAKDKFNRIVAELGYAQEIKPLSSVGLESVPQDNWLGTEEDLKPEAPFLLTLDYEVVAPEIIITDLLSELQCQNLIHKAEQYGNWGNMEGDKFPAQEIRIKKIGLWEEYESVWKEKLGKIAETYWSPMQHIGLRDAFTMKYTPDTQKSLGLHTDASLVTGSVKLNEDYEGGELIFPRQNFSNINVPLGKCILFPSEVTHGHYVPDILKGTKYSLTMWTSRFEGDVN